MIRKLLGAFAVFVVIGSIVSAAGLPPYKEGQLLVRFEQWGYGLNDPDPAARAAARQQILDNAGGGTVLHVFKRLSNWALIELPHGTCVESALVDYASTDGIDFVEPNYRYELCGIPDDTRFGELWGMHNTGQAGGTPGADINAPQAWDFETGSAEVVVAVTDTGVDYTHEDLQANMWINIPEYNGSEGVDDDGNGYIDDIYGYDFSGADVNEPNDGDGDPMDLDGHGTHVSGTVGAVGNNSTGVTGVCWNVSIMALKIFADNSLSTFTSDQVEAIEYAIDNGADIINASWGGYGFSQALRTAIADAQNAGLIFVAAAGNEDVDNDLSPLYPASYNLDSIISVMATNHNDGRSVYSNYGLESVDIAAPGGDFTQGGQAGGILSTLPGDNYGYYEGTSMACPHVAGACALVLSVNPNLTYDEVKELLMNTAEPLPALSGLCVSGARLNIGEAVTEISIDDDPPTPNPAQWAAWGEPCETGINTIAMEAKKAEDKGSVEYYFQCVDNPAFDSGWQSQTLYAATGLSENTQYTFRVRARDDSNNITGWSVEKSATTDSPSDSSPPFPDPPLWQAKPSAIRLTPVIITMQAKAASDESDVEYWFEETVTDVNSGWQDSPTWRPGGAAFSLGNTYNFRFKVRDKSAANNETAYSLTESLTLAPGPRTLPVPSHYPTIQAAVDDTVAGDIVVISPGTYTGHGNVDVNLPDYDITIRSIDPNNPLIIKSTIIDCQNTKRAFNCNSGNTNDTVIAGLTIRNGFIQGEEGNPGSPPPDEGGFPGKAGDGGDGKGGGIICTNGSSPTILNCILDGCYAGGGFGGDPNGGEGGAAGNGYGGGIYCDETSNPVIRGCEFIACGVADGFPTDGTSFGVAYGGGIYAENGSKASIEDCTINGCQAIAIYGGTGRGGGIYHGLANSTVTIADTKITGLNMAGHDGGGICFGPDGSGVVLSNCNVSSNYALRNGGGIYYPKGHSLVIEDYSSVSQNQAGGKGGGIYAGDLLEPGSTTVSITDSVLNDNEARFGGGIYADETVLNMTDSEVSGNNANEGAGINGAGCDLDMLGITINDNEAVTGAGIGAGMALWNSTGQIIDCTFRGNSATSSEGMGGAAYFSGFDSTPKIITNCLFAENKATNEGAGLFFHLGAWAEVNNCTIADNEVTNFSGAGGGISCAEYVSYVQIINSILYGNSAPEGPQLAVGRVAGSVSDPYAIVDVEYSDVQGGEDDVFLEPTGAASVYFLGNNYDEEDFFVSAAADETSYYLKQTAAGQLLDSNLVDAGLGDANGLAALVGFDLTTRTDGVKDTGTVDIGYHYPAVEESLMYRLTISVEQAEEYGADGLLTASGFGFDTIVAANEPNSAFIKRGAEVKLTASPDPGFEVFQWTGADEVPNAGEPNNTVRMNSDKTVTVSFKPEGKYALITEVTTDNGRIDYINSAGEQVPHPGRTFHNEGEVVELIAVPDNETHVTNWFGTDDDITIARKNTVTMDGSEYVTATFFAPDILYVPGEYTNIQTAIDEADDGDIVQIAPGTYTHQGGDLYMLYSIDGKQITLTSIDPEDPCTVASTILNTGIVVTNVGRTCRIEGLTFQDLYYTSRPGFDGGTEENPSPDGENGFPVAGAALRLHNYYFQGAHVRVNLPNDPQPGSSPDIRNCIFRNCGVYGGDGGAGAVVDGQPGDGGWGAWAHGGAVSLGADSNPRFTNCRFINCFARGGDGGNGSDDPPGRGGLWDQTDLGTFGWTFGPYSEFFKYTGLGGAVYVDVNSSPEFIDCEFVNCQAYGGASGVGGGSMWPPVHWRVNRFGGAVYCADESTPTFTRCSFTGNTADVNGPEMWDWESWHSEDEAPAESDDDFLSYGGAVAFEDSANVTFIQCDFNDNTATVGGGVYWTWADPYFNDCSFVDNTGFHGGGILCVGGSGVVENCHFNGNTATIEGGMGGGLASLGANTEIKNTEFIGNYARSSGGGIYVSNKDISGDDEITSWNMVDIENCLIAGNIAGSTGAGISAVWRAYTNIDLCTIADNFILEDGYGGGLYSAYGNYSVLKNSILWGNTAGNGRQIAVRPSQTPAGVMTSYSDIQGGTVYIQPPSTGGNIWVDEDCIFATGPNNIGANLGDQPLFVTGLLGDYYLSQIAAGQPQDSPCVDAGSKPAVELGMLRKTTRTDRVPDRGIVDMGYHYPLDREASKCRVCDLEFTGIVDYADLAMFAEHWMATGCNDDNNWCGGADFNYDTKVDLDDFAFLGSCWYERDTTPPVPDPMKWRMAPSWSEGTSISMGAVEAYDEWGADVEYFFKCSDGDHNSLWQSDPNYTDTGLDYGTQYAYRVKARDQWGNETAFSVLSGAVVGEDTQAPTPNPMTWDMPPYAVSGTQIGMTASQATDASGVEYGFWNLDTGEIVWQDERQFIDDGLDIETTYNYRTAARDKSPSRNTTAWSVSASATTTTEPNEPNVVTDDIYPPETGVYANIYKAAFATPPTEVLLGDGYHHQMTAVTATDQTPPVEYKFICVSNSSFSSGWQESEYYDVLVASSSRSKWVWQVVTRDSVSPTPNVGDRSDYYNCEGESYPYP